MHFIMIDLHQLTALCIGLASIPAPSYDSTQCTPRDFNCKTTQSKFYAKWSSKTPCHQPQRLGSVSTKKLVSEQLILKNNTGTFYINKKQPFSLLTFLTVFGSQPSEARHTSNNEVEWSTYVLCIAN
eukprot:705902-Amphidinium_carterae.1